MAKGVNRSSLRHEAGCAQIYQTYEDQDCPVNGVAAAAAVAAYYGDMGDASCVPGDHATFLDGSTVPYCDQKQPSWSAYRHAVYHTCY